MTDRRWISGLVLLLLFVSLACNLPGAVARPQGSDSPGLPAAQPSAANSPMPAQGGSPAPPEPAATVTPITHIATPGSPPASGKLYYDVESSGTGPEHRAPYGDSYDPNLFERPFTRTDMNYLPALDISTFKLSEDATWFYVSIDLIGGDPNDAAEIKYGVELDTNHDGFGDVLIWAGPPFLPEWSAETLQVYTDTDHDTGGASAEKSDAVYPGNGYDKVTLDRGQGADPDLAFVRSNPGVSAAIQFAFKRSLAGGAFMWGVWADSGLKNPGLFNYNDRFTETDAGSPEKSEKYYPIDEIFQADNTCWPAYGFKPNGYEPHLCPSLEPRPTRVKPVPSTVPTYVPPIIN